jgi:hypothetical protein
MSYADIKPTIVEVNPLTKAELPGTKEYRKVPIAIVDHVQVNGSDAIVDALFQNQVVQRHDPCQESSSQGLGCLHSPLPSVGRIREAMI